MVSLTGQLIEIRGSDGCVSTSQSMDSPFWVITPMDFNIWRYADWGIKARNPSAMARRGRTQFICHHSRAAWPYLPPQPPITEGSPSKEGLQIYWIPLKQCATKGCLYMPIHELCANHISKLLKDPSILLVCRCCKGPQVPSSHFPGTVGKVASKRAFVVLTISCLVLCLCHICIRQLVSRGRSCDIFLLKTIIPL